MDIIVKQTLSTAQAGGIAITAAEGGINLWAIVDEYKWSRWDGEDGPAEVPEDFVFYTIVGLTEGPDLDLMPEPIPVTPRLIATGIERFLAEGRRFDDDDGFEYMDSAEADIVVQLGAFGKVVFG